MNIRFSDIPDHARTWVFASPELLEPEQSEHLREIAERFVEGWTAHGAPVFGSHELRYDRFLLIAADEARSGVSGCSIDALSRTLRAAEAALGASLLDSASSVWYRDASSAIRCVTRAEFRALVAAGEVDGDTLVFDHTVPTVGDIRAGRWERPLRESWHASAFRVAASA